MSCVGRVYKDEMALLWAMVVLAYSMLKEV